MVLNGHKSTLGVFGNSAQIKSPLRQPQSETFHELLNTSDSRLLRLIEIY